MCVFPWWFVVFGCVRTRRDDKISRTHVENNFNPAPAFQSDNIIDIFNKKTDRNIPPGILFDPVGGGQFDPLDQNDTLAAECMKSEGTILFYVNEYVAAVYFTRDCLLETWKNRQMSCLSTRE